MDKARKIIVIEDERDINNLIAYNLRKEGFVVKQVIDGIAASAILKREHFDIVILDIMLPGIDGFDICKELKERDDAYKTFVIVVSARTATQDKLYAHIMGADYYITKPFEVSSLMGVVSELCTILEKEFLVKSP